MFRVLPETNVFDAMAESPKTALLAILLVFIAVCLVIAEWRRRRIEQDKVTAKAAKAERKRQAKLLRFPQPPPYNGPTAAVVLMATLLTGCGQSLHVTPRLAMWNDNTHAPITVMFGTGLLPEVLRCARVEWDFGDGCVSKNESDASEEAPCSDRRSISHKFTSSGIFSVRATFFPSVGKSVPYNGTVNLVGERERIYLGAPELQPISGEW